MGFPLARRLVAQGYTVKGSTTTRAKLETLGAAGIEPYLITLSPDLSEANIASFFTADALVLNVPPPRGRNDLRAYHRQQIEAVREAARAGTINWVLFASSTGVYPRADRVVTEDNVPDPHEAPDVLRPSGAAVLEAERLLQAESAFDTSIVRFAGLYGGERDPGRFLAGRKAVPGGDAPVNLIHRDDCIGILVALLEQEARGVVVNACADTHPTRRALYTAAAKRLGVEPPTFESGGVNKVVSNQAVKRLLNYTFQHPDPLQDMRGV